MRIECGQNLRMRLEGHEDGFGGRNAPRTCQAICEGYLCRWWRSRGGDLVFGRHFVGILIALSVWRRWRWRRVSYRAVLRLLRRQRLYRLYACGGGGNEVVQVVGRENGAHGELQCGDQAGDGSASRSGCRLLEPLQGRGCTAALVGK